jgi:Protein of unknown function (DUF3800)
MYLLFADEFGDYTAPHALSAELGYRPICGYAGILIPAVQYKVFCDNFLRLRMIADANILMKKFPDFEYISKIYQKNRVASAIKLEVKGKDIFSSSYMVKMGRAEKKRNIIRYAHYFLRLLDSHAAEIVYYGIKKESYFAAAARRGKSTARPLHVDLVRGLLDVAHHIGKERLSSIKLIFDHHPKDDETVTRVKAKNEKKAVHAMPELQTRQEYAREVILEKGYYDYIKEPMFFLKSDWSLGIQAADWVCTLLARSKYVECTSELCGPEFSGRYRYFHDKLGGYISALTTAHSTVKYHEKPKKAQLELGL